MLAQNIISFIKKYLYLRYQVHHKNADISVRFNRKKKSFYVYNHAAGYPICVSTLRIADHVPDLRNYINPAKTDFNYPAGVDKEDPDNVQNISIEFYDPNRSFEYLKNIKSPYEFSVLRYCYKTDKLSEDDIKKILVNMVDFIENGAEKYEDPLDGTSKHAYIKKGTGYKYPMGFPLPDDVEKYGSLNYHKVYNTFESSTKTHEYIFISFDDDIDIKEAVENIILEEMKKRAIYEMVMKTFKHALWNMISKLK